ncbi:MFS transporter [Anaeromyxobacter sp. Fw109-5]|uniref:MFS transporter n=1 Tax=Anaeromyxobacter sp. (strain Fw109-5) TaxID=404589 RepID=UPI0000ED6EAE|nr:MFS transporter [Anaeromyxobacter sp. Fw109-5]ABS28128.1 major facilitator superfamily MFS_1 [Anaeromyxobacter sp. Fw109-5]
MTAPDPGLAPPQPSWRFRWLVLLACSVAMFGNYYVFDALYPVTPLLQEQLGFTDQQIGLLDTAYNVAALLTLIAGGVLIDRLGTARAAVLFGAVGAAGSALIAFLPAAVPGAPALSMAAGRFVLGVGSELFIVAATTVVGRWFKGKEISSALAVQLLIARFGSWVADRSPDLAKELFGGWQPPLLLAASFGVLWLVFAVVYAALETYAGRRYGVGRAVQTDKLVLGDLVRFSRGYWWVVGLCVAFYATIFPFRTFANLFFIQAHGVAPETAGALKSWLPLLSMIGMPIFGLLADLIGKRALLMTVGSALLVPPFLLMAYTDLPLELSMAMLGLSFALVPAVLWPAVTYLVPEARLGSAYALMTFCQQAAWALMSWGIGAVNDAAGASAQHPAGWLPAMWMLAGLATAGFVFSFLLWREERGPGAHGLEARAGRHAA